MLKGREIDQPASLGRWLIAFRYPPFIIWSSQSSSLLKTCCELYHENYYWLCNENVCLVQTHSYEVKTSLRKAINRHSIDASCVICAFCVILVCQRNRNDCAIFSSPMREHMNQRKSESLHMKTLGFLINCRHIILNIIMIIALVII